MAVVTKTPPMTLFSQPQFHSLSSSSSTLTLPPTKSRHFHSLSSSSIPTNKPRYLLSLSTIPAAAVQNPNPSDPSPNTVFRVLDVAKKRIAKIALLLTRIAPYLVLLAEVVIDGGIELSGKTMMFGICAEKWKMVALMCRLFFWAWIVSRATGDRRSDDETDD